MSTEPTVLDVLRTGSRSFHFASRFLPEENRRDAALLYAFCRCVDDLADDRTDDDEAREALDRVRLELRGAAEPRPLVAAFVAMAGRRGIDLGHAEALLDGVRSDVGRVVVADDEQLRRYCYRVAGTVGLMMSPLLGVTDPRAAPHALDLGIAMQLTNIARDVAEDAREERVYLPATRLRAEGLSSGQLLAGGVDRARLARVVSDLLALAERYYRSADHGMVFIPLRPRVAILVASRVYRAIGRRILARGADVLSGRTVVSGFGKLLAAGGALLALLRPALWGLGRRPHVAALHAGLEGLDGASPARRSRGGAQPARLTAGAQVGGERC